MTPEMLMPEGYHQPVEIDGHMCDSRELLLEADAELRGLLPTEAIEASMVSTAELPHGAWMPPTLAPVGEGSLGLQLLSGFMSTTVEVAGRTSLEVLGPGELLCPWARQHPLSLVQTSFAWDVHTPVRVAVLDAEFSRQMCEWPEFFATMSRRATLRTRQLALQAAINSHPTVRERLILTMESLADRWGKMTPAGIVVPIPLRHRHLALMVGAQRPTVSRELAALRRVGRLTPTGTGWLLASQTCRCA